MRHASAASVTNLFSYLDRQGIAIADVAPPGVAAIVRLRSGARVPAWLVPMILERCAAHLGDPLFGLRYGRQVDPAIFGPVSLLWKYAPTIRYSNRITARILHLQHEGIGIAVRDVDDETSSLIYRVDLQDDRENRQFIESGIGFMLRVCRLIMGETWAPQRFMFAREPLASPRRYAEILDAPVTFDAPTDGMIVRTADLDRRSPHYDAQILGFVEKSLLRTSEREPLPFRERLDQVVDDLIAIRELRLKAAAAAMAMSSRTLQRHLSDDGVSFRQVVNERRRAIIADCRQRAVKPSLALLADRTGFSEGSAVSRFLKQRSRSPDQTLQPLVEQAPLGGGEPRGVVEAGAQR